MPTRRALVAVFVANGLGGPSILARLPERQRALEVSDAGLGAVVLGLAAGALVASPVAGWAVSRFGSRPVAVASGCALAATLWAAGAAPGAPLAFAALLVVGAADAVMDTSMNANGAAHERGTGRSVLHGLHAAWSLGALLGAGGAAAAAHAGLSPTVHLAIVGAAVGILAVAARPDLVAGDARPRPARPAPALAEPGHGAGAPAAPPAPAGGAAPEAADPDGAAPGSGHAPRRRLPAAVVLLAAGTVGGAFIEGVGGEWSALQLDRLGVREALAPLGVAAFMGGMLAGRLVGDRLTDRLGGRVLLRRSLLLAAAGLALGAAWAEPIPFVVGVAAAGFGASPFFPLAFSAAGRTPGVAPGAGAATVSLAARIGFLVEPPLVGTIADATDLRVAFGAAALVAAGLALAARRW